MEAASQLIPPTPPEALVGYCSNGGIARYLLEAESTTGFVAWRLADGPTLVSAAPQVSLEASAAVGFWSCAGYEDPSPFGSIISFDCHGNQLTAVDITALRNLKYLDISYNRLEELALDGLSELQVLDADDNNLRHLDVKQLGHLRVLNCANNHLQSLDLSGLDLLQILDCSNNRITSLHVRGCTSLQTPCTEGNLLT